MKQLRPIGYALAAVVFALLAYAWWLTRRALPILDAEIEAAVSHKVDIVRDTWGVPHIFAEEDEDAYFALGFVHAQDRLFQLELARHAAQGRLAELVGAPGEKLDRLFRTMDFHGTAKRMLERARPEARAAAEAYARGVNAGAASFRGRLPPEFALLGRGFAEARPDDFVGVLGTMSWNLHYSWIFDPLYERLLSRVGAERAAELFPLDGGGAPAVHPTAPKLALGLFRFTDEERALLDALPSLRASNNWVVGPKKSANAHALLANDPHLGHALPPIWYEAHLKSRSQDVMGVTLPGFPLIVIGHNREIAWGFTNVMQDSADFFLEKLDPARPDEVMYRGEWVRLVKRRETLRVKGKPDVVFEVRLTPHGPLVNDLLPDQRQALSYRWTFNAAEHANEVDGFFALNRARDWDEFRGAVSRFGAVAQNAVFADKDGHIGLQTTGAYPRLAGKRDGQRFRVGWDGSEEWDGFHDFQENPSSFDPPQGWLASANNPTLPAPGPFYVSSHWEPADRITRIQEVLRSRDKLSLDELKLLQSDTTLLAARELAPLVVEAFARRPPDDPGVRAALELLSGWDFLMRADGAAPAVFAVFYRRLFYEIFEDELGEELAKGYRSKLNLSATMMRAVLSNAALARWLDRSDTKEVIEDRGAILRSAFEAAVAELRRVLGGAPASWSWGRLHTLRLVHPLGRASRLLGFYFDRGPYPVPGATSTVNKMEYEERDFKVVVGPSMRQITDMQDLNASLAVLPGGQSGLPASLHYDDQLRLWLAGQYHPFPIDRGAIEQRAAHRLWLVPAAR